jgi:hypothetical protein
MAAEDRSATIGGACPATCHDLGQGGAEVLPVVRGQRRDETAELRAEAAGQLGHAPGAVQEDAQQPGLDRSQVVTFGDARVDGLYRGGELCAISPTSLQYRSEIVKVL